MKGRKRTKAETWRVSGFAGGGVTWNAASEPKDLKQSDFLTILGSASSAGGSHKKKKAAVRKESAETQGHASDLQKKSMEIDNDKSLEEMGVVPSAMNESGGWHEALRVKKMCDKKKLAFTFLIVTLHPYWWKMSASRTRSTSVEGATTSDGQKEANLK